MRRRRWSRATWSSPDGPRPGVLVLHSWWGSDPGQAVWRRSPAGLHRALAPDLLDGARPAGSDEGHDVLAASDPNETAALVLSSIGSAPGPQRRPDRRWPWSGSRWARRWALWAATANRLRRRGRRLRRAEHRLRRVAPVAPGMARPTRWSQTATWSRDAGAPAPARQTRRGPPLYPGTGHWIHQSGAGDHRQKRTALAWERPWVPWPPTPAERSPAAAVWPSVAGGPPPPLGDRGRLSVPKIVRNAGA